MSGLGMSADQAGYRLQTIRVCLSKKCGPVLISTETFVFAPQQNTQCNPNYCAGVPILLKFGLLFVSPVS